MSPVLIDYRLEVLLPLRFVGIQKACHSLDRNLLRQVLFRNGLQMITVIRYFHDVMKVCSKPSDGTCSKPFEVNQRLRQRCVLCPLLFNIPIAAVRPPGIQQRRGHSQQARVSTRTAARNKTQDPNRQCTPGRLEYAIC